MKKVYCEDCKYLLFSRATPESDLRCANQRAHQEIDQSTPLRRIIKTVDKIQVLNKENDCKFFELMKKDDLSRVQKEQNNPSFQ